MPIDVTAKDYCFHFVAYYTAWFGTILFAAHNHSLFAVLAIMTTTLAQIVWQIYVARRTQGLWLMMSLFFVFGTLVDTLLMKIGIIEFAANPFGHYLSAPWMSGLWLSFAITFYSIMSSFFELYVLDSILSLIFFPIAYILGVKLQAAFLPYGYPSSIIIGLIWALLFPLTLKIYHSRMSWLKP